MNAAERRLFYWLRERVRDAIRWPLLLVLYLPRRLARLANTLGHGLAGLAAFAPGLVHARADGHTRLWLRRQVGGAFFWLHRLVNELFDIAGGPEIVNRSGQLTFDQMFSCSRISLTNSSNSGPSTGFRTSGRPM